MNIFQEEVNNLIVKIQDAYKNEIYPGDNHIVKHGLETRDDGLDTLNSFKGQLWEKVTLDVLISNRDNIYYFTPEAYHYYSPAYMIAILSHYNEIDVLKNNFLYSLTPPMDKNDLNEYIARTKSFNQHQRIVIKEFLIMYGRLIPDALLYDPNHHLERAKEYWENY